MNHRLPQLLYLLQGDNNSSTRLIRCQRLKEFIHVEHIKQCLIAGKCSVNVHFKKVHETEQKCWFLLSLLVL